MKTMKRIISTIFILLLSINTIAQKKNNQVRTDSKKYNVLFISFNI